MAPHVMVEDISVASIEAARDAYATTNLRVRLARYHADVDSAFRGWNDIWLHPDFRAWNIEEYLPRITDPVLIVQGENDEYGSVRQVEAIASQVRGSVTTLVLPNCGHSPHVERAAEVLDAVTRFV